MTRAWLLAAVVAALLLSPPAPAGAQSPLFDPGAWQDMAARALAGAIEMAREEAVRAGTQPIPAEIRRKLAGDFPAELLDRVTYHVGREGALAMQAIRYGHIQAVTLVDVIVFPNADDARANDALWAHELTHVRQYERWGLEEFARRYARDYNAVEAEAYGFQADYEARNGRPARPGG